MSAEAKLVTKLRTALDEIEKALTEYTSSPTRVRLVDLQQRGEIAMFFLVEAKTATRITRTSDWFDDAHGPYLCIDRGSMGGVVEITICGSPPTS